MRFLLLFILLTGTFICFAQHELDAKDDCKTEVLKDFVDNMIAVGSKDCVKFKPDYNRNYTFQVFSKVDQKILIYQVSIFNGEKHGLEVFYIEQEKTVQLYNKGDLVNCIVYYESGELRLIQQSKRVLEYSKDGILIKRHLLDKKGGIKKTKSVIKE